MLPDTDTLMYAQPVRFAREFWPDVTFYRQQLEVIYSVMDNRETVVVAANAMGKDFVAGFIVLWFFLSRQPCKIVTTSVEERHLKVLWGEVDKFIRTSKYPLLYNPKTGVNTGLLVNEDGMKKVIDGQVYKDSYAIRIVASEKSIEKFQGHHCTPDPGQPVDDLPRNLFVADEASGVPDDYYKMADTWMRRALIFGNPWPCSNFFYRAVKGNPKTKDRGGDLPWA